MTLLAACRDEARQVLPQAGPQRPDDALPAGDLPLLPPLPQTPGPGQPPRSVAARDVPAPSGGPGWVDPARCVGCHAEQAALHAGSHHALAMAPATRSTVRGDFGDASFEHAGAITRFVQREGRFAVQSAGADGTIAEYEAAYTFGVEPLQQVLLRFPAGRLQALQVAWDVARHRWFPLSPASADATDAAFHWAGRFHNANAMCLECHVTAYRKGYDPATDAYSSTWMEFGVGCQACHGPGAAHVDWAESGAREPVSRSGLVVDAAGADQAGQCAECHARRRRVAVDPQPGAPLLDGWSPARLDEGLYHADGQILDEVFEYGSFVQSPMHRAGVRCSDCHEPHGLGLRAPGNAVCTQCHTAARADPRFPTLKPGEYDTPEHHGHAPGGPGSACVDCHMPARTYMEVDPRRDHSLRVPRPGLSAALGTPDACTGCHADRDGAWAAGAIEEWAAKRGTPSRQGEPHFGTTLAEARRGRAGVAVLAALALDVEQPAIVRATAVDHLARAGPGAEPTLSRLADDAEPLVRLAVAESLDLLDAGTARRLGGPLAADALRAVRVATALSLGAGLGGPRRDPAADPAIGAAPVGPAGGAVDEFLAVEAALSDLPDGAFRVGLFALRSGWPRAAESAWTRALALDPLDAAARLDLVQLLGGEGRAEEAEALLRDGLQRQPQDGQTHYALGLLLAQEGRLPAALPHLGEAARLLPADARAAYNLGLALLHLGRGEEAEIALRDAVQRDPAEADARARLLALALDRGHDSLALTRARQLAALVPLDAELAALVTTLAQNVAMDPESRHDERQAMVAEQIAARGVSDAAVLAALAAVPRHRFVPREQSHLAYVDAPLAIGQEQTISQPYIVARMTGAVAPRAGERVLEIGTGSGYQAAVLAELTPFVSTIEILPELAARAAGVLAGLGYDGVRCRAGDGWAGWPEHAPFDVILLTAAPEELPPALVAQLAPGGRLCLPLGPPGSVQDLVLVEKDAAGRVSRRVLDRVRFVPMTGAARDR